MLSKLLLVLALLMPATVNAENNKLDNIYQSIKGLTHNFDDSKAKYYAALINDFSDEYRVEWEVAVAIFKQESNFDTSAVNYLTRDFGIGQLHYKTIQNRNLDLGLILTDPKYAIEETFKLLSELKVKYDKIDKRKGRKWYTRYHSFTKEHRDDYAAQLDRTLKNIKRLVDGRLQKNKRKIYQGRRQADERGFSEGEVFNSDSAGE